jgi:hypothetical protein
MRAYLGLGRIEGAWPVLPVDTAKQGRVGRVFFPDGLNAGPGLVMADGSNSIIVPPFRYRYGW